MSWPGRDRWLALWASTGAATPSAQWYDTLTAAYAEPHRRYHNQTHIAECLAEFDQARHLARQPAAVELALWFHDAVYDPKRADNEERSAALAVRCFVDAGLAETVSKLVMATKSHEVSGDSDMALTVDIDLCILGQPEQRFFEYEGQIREEYSWVPQNLFASKRAEILQLFLARERIFATDWFRNKYEGSARHNLEASIAKLGQLCS